MRRTALGVVAAAVATAALAATARAQEKPPVELGPDAVKTRKVVLYKHGVGYFERAGKVEGNARINLFFKEPQMRDLLKSFWALDLGGGTISTVAYEGQQPIQKRLEEIRIHVDPKNALSGLVRALQGVQVELDVAGTKSVGRVLGLEPYTKKIDDKQTIETAKVVFQAPDGAIRSIDLLDVSGLSIKDETLDKEMKRYLELLQDARRTGQKRVTVTADGKGAREIRIGYIVESPIWKTSYRLIFDKDKQPLLQGWAIVDNATEEDWDSVELALVGGSPISFVLDLYTPFYPRRPEVSIRRFASAAAEPAESGAGAPPGAPKPGAHARRMKDVEEESDEKKGEAAPLAEGAAPAPPPEPEKSFAENLSQSVKSAAQGAQVGELFQYRVALPVSIKRGGSGLVPILLERVDGKKVLYYTAKVQPVHPMNAVLLKNSTALSLESGPITFYEEATCAGEGMLSRLLRAGDDELCPYSVDATVTVDTASRSRSSPVTRYSLVNGMLTLYSFHHLETVYKVHNRGGKAFTLYLDHPKTAGYELAGDQKPEVDLPGVLRFKLEVKAGDPTEFVVPERRELSNTTSFYGANPDVIAFHLSQEYLKEKTKKFLGEVQAIAAELQQAARRTNELRQEEQTIQHDQERLRSNMGALRNNAEENKIRSRYIATLEKGDGRIEAIRTELAELAEKTNELQKRLREKLVSYREE